MCFILERSDGFWLWPRMRCVSPDDTYLICMLGACSSQRHPLRTLPIDLSSVCGGQGPQLFPSEVRRLPLRKVDLLSSHSVPWVLLFSWWWASVRINYSYCCSLLNTFHPQPSARKRVGQPLICQSTRRHVSHWAVYLGATVPSPAINTALG